MTTPLSLADLETLREGWDFEAKLALGRDNKGELPKSLWETYAAMANTEGGVILLGARERSDHTLDLVGLSNPHKVETDLWNGLNNPQRVSANVLRQDDVTTITDGTTTVLLIQVPKAERHQRPVYLKGNAETGTYVRLHEGDRHVPPEQVHRMLGDRTPSRDERVLEHYSADDLDPESLARYRTLFLNTRRDGHPFSSDEHQEFLHSIGAWRRDRASKTEGLTLAGLLMLGRETAIRDLYPHWHLSYREEEPGSDLRWSDRVHTDGSWPGNLFSFYLRVIPKLTAGVKVPFAIGPGGQRIDDTPVHRALREAFVNTLIHADYAGPSGIRVMRRPHGFEFINPGLPLIPVERIWQGGSTVARNPTLQRLFGLIALGEREGSGGPAIFKAWQSQQWQRPTMRQDIELQETHLALSQVSLLPAESLDAMTDEWGEAFTSLDELGRLAVTTAHAEDGLITHPRLRELTEEHSRTITLKLQDLVKAGFLESSGGGRGTKYHLQHRDRSQGSLFDRREPLNSLESSPEVAPNSLEVAPNSLEVGPDPLEADDSAEDAIIEKVAGQRWARKDDVRSAILAIARGRFVTVAELSGTLQRKPVTIQQHLSVMAKDGLLDIKHPDQPNHPAQAYRSRKDPTP